MRSLLVLVLTLAPVLSQAASETEKAREKLAKSGTLFTPEAFIRAAESGEGKTVELFLKAGMDVNARNESGETALIEAADGDHAELVALLLRSGADVNARTQDGATALYKCVKSGHAGGGRVVRAALLGAKADVTLRYRYNETALHAAASSTNPEAMKALIAAGAEVDARNERGETALYDCACTDRTREMAVLIEAGADVNTRTKDETTPLMSAAMCGEADVVTALLAAKADPKLADKNGRTAILGIAQFNMHFVKSGRTPEENLGRIVKELVAAGADPNSKQKYDGATPLMEAAKQDDLPVVRALIEAGANVNAKDNYGNTALQEAKDKPEIAAALKAAAAVARPPASKK